MSCGLGHWIERRAGGVLYHSIKQIRARAEQSREEWPVRCGGTGESESEIFRFRVKKPTSLGTTRRGTEFQYLAFLSGILESDAACAVECDRFRI